MGICVYTEELHCLFSLKVNSIAQLAWILNFCFCLTAVRLVPHFLWFNKKSWGCFQTYLVWSICFRPWSPLNLVNLGQQSYWVQYVDSVIPSYVHFPCIYMTLPTISSTKVNTKTLSPVSLNWIIQPTTINKQQDIDKEWQLCHIKIHPSRETSHLGWCEQIGPVQCHCTNNC